MVDNYIFHKKKLKFGLKLYYYNTTLLKHLKYNKVNYFNNNYKYYILRKKNKKFILNLIKNLFFFVKFGLQKLSRQFLVKIYISLLLKRLPVIFYIPL
jgi:hypothetical protein